MKHQLKFHINFRLFLYNFFLITCLVGCFHNDDDNNPMNPPPVIPPVVVENTVTISVDLFGDQETPAVITTAEGNGMFTLDLDSGELSGSIMTSGITITAAHIHKAFSGLNGSVIVTLNQDESDTSTWLVADGTMLTAEDMQSFSAGELYINVHSATNPGGELRGQLLPDNITVMWSQLSGTNEVPMVTTTASGRAALTLNTDTMAVVLHAMTMDLADASAAHIHTGMAGMNGGVAVGLEQDMDDINHWWVANTFTQEQYDALMAGGLYVNVHSATNPGGELRGQL